MTKLGCKKYPLDLLAREFKKLEQAGGKDAAVAKTEMPNGTELEGDDDLSESEDHDYNGVEDKNEDIVVSDGEEDEDYDLA